MTESCRTCVDLWEKAVAAISHHHKLNGCAHIAVLTGEGGGPKLTDAVETARLDKEQALAEYTAHTRTHAAAVV